MALFVLVVVNNVVRSDPEALATINEASIYSVLAILASLVMTGTI